MSTLPGWQEKAKISSSSLFNFSLEQGFNTAAEREQAKISSSTSLLGGRNYILAIWRIELSFRLPSDPFFLIFDCCKVDSSDFSWPHDFSTPLQQKLQFFSQDEKYVGWTCLSTGDLDCAHEASVLLVSSLQKRRNFCVYRHAGQWRQISDPLMRSFRKSEQKVRFE